VRTILPATPYRTDEVPRAAPTPAIPAGSMRCRYWSTEADGRDNGDGAAEFGAGTLRWTPIEFIL